MKRISTAFYLILLGCVASITFVPGVKAGSFEAQGVISYSNFNNDQSNLVSRYSFSTYVSETQYSIRLVPPTSEVIDYRDVAFDGTNAFVLTSYVSSMPERRKQFPKLGTNSNIAGGYMSKGPIVHYSLGHEIGPLWLALASGSYFAAATNDIIEGVLAIDYLGKVTPETIRWQKATWDCQSAFPNIPKHATFFDSGSVPRFWSNRPPYNAGYTSAVYEVQQWNTFSGMLLPKEATLQVYFPKKDGKRAEDLRLAMLYTITVTNAAMVAHRTVAPPRMPGLTTIGDNRFAKAGPLSVAPMLNWPTEEAVQRSVQYSNALLVDRFARPPMPKKTGSIVPILCVILLTLPLAFLLVRAKRQKTTPTQQ